MKNFIEVTDKSLGTILINIDYICTVSPRIGLNGINSEISVLNGRNDNQAAKYQIVETYAKVKSLIADALK